ncbi:MAG: DNA methyltransferase [Anaerolineae bacterium]
MLLDPFMGSGTSVKVAYEMGRTAIGSDLVLPDIHEF